MQIDLDFSSEKLTSMAAAVRKVISGYPAGQQIDESNELVSEGEKVYKNDDVMKAQDGFCKTLSEVRFAVQEWGIKNNLRLFGIIIDEWEDPRDCNKTILMAEAFFTDINLKSMMKILFIIKEIGGKVTASRPKWWTSLKDTKWPIKIMRTKRFINNDLIEPIGPLYWVLVDREIILPFKSMMKKKDWLALPFEDDSGIKSTEVIR